MRPEPIIQLEANGREFAAETAGLAAENSGVGMIDDNMAFAMAADGQIPPKSLYPQQQQQQRATSGKVRYAEPPMKGAFGGNFNEFVRSVNASHQPIVVETCACRMSFCCTPTGAPVSSGQAR